MSTIYAVTQGEYSDYGIVAIYSTRELAEARIAEIERTATMYSNTEGSVRYQHGSEATIEEFECDAAIESPSGRYVGTIEPRGRPPGCESSRFEEGKDPHAPASVTDWQNWPSIHGYGETREHAIRSARELWRAIKAGTVVLPEPLRKLCMTPEPSVTRV